MHLTVQAKGNAHIIFEKLILYCVLELFNGFFIVFYLKNCYRRPYFPHFFVPSYFEGKLPVNVFVSLIDESVG